MDVSLLLSVVMAWLAGVFCPCVEFLVLARLLRLVGGIVCNRRLSGLLDVP